MVEGIQEFVKDKRILFVGNSAESIRYGLAGFINKFDIVVRFGRAIEFIAEKYGLIPKMHFKDLPLLEKSVEIAKLYNVQLDPPPLKVDFINENESIKLGATKWDIICTPGHATGHICLLEESKKKLIAGDVIFFMSIGRTDLPGSNHSDLIDSIKNKLFVLEDDIEIYCGHGENTSIGFEKMNNPFLRI